MPFISKATKFFSFALLALALSACGKSGGNDAGNALSIDNTSKNSPDLRELISDTLKDQLTRWLGDSEFVSSLLAGENAPFDFNEDENCPLGGTITATGVGSAQLSNGVLTTNLDSQAVTFNSCKYQDTRLGQAVTLTGTVESKNSQGVFRDIGFSGLALQIANSEASGAYKGTLAVTTDSIEISSCNVDLAVGATNISGSINLNNQGSIALDTTANGSVCGDTVNESESINVSF